MWYMYIYVITCTKLVSAQNIFKVSITTAPSVIGCAEMWENTRATVLYEPELRYPVTLSVTHATQVLTMEM